MAFLQVKTSDGSTREIELRDQPVVIGRSTEADVVLGDTQASRRHAVLEPQPDGQWLLRDLGSRNKTLINKQPVNTHVLRHGDVFTIGTSHLCFLAKRADAAPTPPRPAVKGTVPAKRTVCPQCKAPVDASAVLCVRCGFNLKTGKRLVTNVAGGPQVRDDATRTAAPDDSADLPTQCPCCEQALPPHAKLCVACGIDVRTGRSIQTVQDKNLDEVYMYAESTITWLSWLFWVGIYPIASEAFGVRKPWAVRGIAVATVLISVWFMFAGLYNPNPSAFVMNLVQWNGSPAAQRKIVEARRQEIERARQRLKAMGAKDKQIDQMMALHEDMAEEEKTGEFRPYQLLTSAFLHGGFVHLAGNMLFLMVLGSRVNALIGNLLTLALYPFLAVVASLAHMLSVANDPISSSLGASGAVMGLAGMYLMLMPVPQVHMAAWWRWGLIGGFHLNLRLFAVRGFWVVLFFISFDVIYTVFGLKDNVAHWAHLGGFLAGMLMGLLLLFSRLVNARGGDLLSVILGKRAWPLLGKPNRQTPVLW